jgi:hypothetical protein
MLNDEATGTDYSPPPLAPQADRRWGFQFLNPLNPLNPLNTPPPPLPLSTPPSQERAIIGGSQGAPRGLR